MLRKISLFFLLLFSLNVWADVAYETWYCPSWPCPTTNQTILSSGTLTTTINYDWGGGYVLDSGRTDYVVVHLTGTFVMPGTAGQSYTVTFLNQDDDGSRLNVGGTTVIEDWSGLHGPANRTGNITLVGGQTYTYERWFSEWGGGAVMRQMWYIPGIHGGYTYMNATTDFISAQAQQPAYSSDITILQQSRKTTETAQRTSQSGNLIHIDQVGDNNTITIRQGTTLTGKNRIELYANGNTNTLNLNQGYNVDGTVPVDEYNNHYQYLNLSGNSNSITTKQTGGTINLGHFMESTVSGNTNNLNLIQQGTGSKTLFLNANGGANSVTTNQKDGGEHFLDINLMGNGHTVNAIQEGAGNHAATIDFTNAGGASSLTVTQGGATNQTYSIQQSCTNPAGCSTIITQP